MSNSESTQLFGSSESTQRNKLQWQANTKLGLYYMSIPGSRNQKFQNSTSSASGPAAINQETPNLSNSEGSAASSLKLNQSTAASTATTVPVRAASLPGTSESKSSSDQKLPNKAGPQCLSSSSPDVDALKKNDTAITTSTSLPTQTTSLPAVSSGAIPAPQNDITNNFIVNHQQSSTVKGLETNKEEKNPDPVKPLKQDDKMQRVCKSCDSRYEKEENTANVEEWLYSDTCPNCHEVILNHHRSISRLQSPKHHKTTTTNYHDEEEVNSCCCF